MFSLRWGLPPTLGCIPKQPDSGDAQGLGTGDPQGPDTRSGSRPDQEDSGRPGARRSIPNATVHRAREGGGFGAGLFPLHSPLLGKSWLVSFPPLSDMLKFSGEPPELRSTRGEWMGGDAGAARPRHGASRVHPGLASAGRAAPAARRPPLGAAGAPRRRRSRPGPAAESGPPVRPRDPTLRQAWPRERPGAAVCVQRVDDQCVRGRGQQVPPAGERCPGRWLCRGGPCGAASATHGRECARACVRAR